MAIDLMDLEAARKQLKLKSVETLRRAIRNKRLKATRIGKGYKTTQQWLGEYVEREGTEVE
jgi:hypothetical protein